MSYEIMTLNQLICSIEYPGNIVIFHWQTKQNIVNKYPQDHRVIEAIRIFNTNRETVKFINYLILN